MKLINIYKHTVTYCLIALLTACATLSTRQGALNESLSWDERQQQLEQIQQWTAQGAISVRATDTNGTASINWLQTGNRYDIRLFGPLGSGQMQIEGNPTYVTLTTSKKEQYTAPTAEQLLFEHTGWYLPVSNLYHWIRGLPAPDSPATTQLDTFQHLQQLQQEGWTIDYLRYTSVNGIDLPSRINLSNQQLNIRLVINRWKI